MLWATSHHFRRVKFCRATRADEQVDAEVGRVGSDMAVGGQRGRGPGERGWWGNSSSVRLPTSDS